MPYVSAPSEIARDHAANRLAALRLGEGSGSVAAALAARLVAPS